MLGVEGIRCYSVASSPYLNFKAVSGNVLEKNAQGVITDLHLECYPPGVARYTISKDLKNDMVSLFTFNDEGNLSGHVNATKGSQLFDAIARLSKKVFS